MREFPKEKVDRDEAVFIKTALQFIQNNEGA